MILLTKWCSRFFQVLEEFDVTTRKKLNSALRLRRTVESRRIPDLPKSSYLVGLVKETYVTGIYANIKACEWW